VAKIVGKHRNIDAMAVSYGAMKRGIFTALAIAAGCALALAGLAVASLSTAQTTAPRLPFSIATGTTGGTYFPVGEAIADIVSHPPGFARCDVNGVCGPAGLAATARTSPGAVANVLDVNDGRADAGLAQSDVVAEAVAGRGAFLKAGRQSHIRMIADLFPEDVHVVAAAGAHIRTIADLQDKRVGLGAPESGTVDTARAVLTAYRISPSRLKASYDPAEISAQSLERGEIDAFFFVGGAPVAIIQNLIARGNAVLVPIDGPARERLMQAEPGLEADTIAAQDYPGSRSATETVSVHAIWIVNDATSADVVYGVTRALFNPANRQLLDDAHPSARFIRLETATADIPAPLHPGAIRFYREMGIPLGAAAASRNPRRG
jgi:TRAP transporter TAXI family solute receptor